MRQLTEIIRRHATVIIMMAACLFVSCNDDVVVHHYDEIPEEGWYRRDTIVIHGDSIRKAGRYVTSFCVRANSEYPYRNLTVMMSQTVMPSGVRQQNTLRLRMMDDNGARYGNGIVYKAQEQEAFTQELLQGDSVLVVIKHHMRRETLPGITGVGIKITRK